MSGKGSFRTRLGGRVLTNLIALVLIYVFCGNCLLEAKSGISAGGGSSPEVTTRNSTVQERILKIPQGKMVEVRFTNRQRLRGRLGEISNEGFGLQTAEGNKIEAQKISFTDVKSVKQVERSTGKKVGTTVLIGLAGLGVLLVVGMIAYAGG